MSFPDLGVCANCHHGDHWRCAEMWRDVSCSCVGLQCVADRARLHSIEGTVRVERVARKAKVKARLGSLSNGRTPRNDPRISAHERTETVRAGAA